MATARAVAAHRRAQVVELATTTDLTYDQIASRVGYAHRGNVSRALWQALNERTTEAVDEMRALELHRLDRLQQALWEDAVSGDVRAVDAVLRIIDRRVKLLGLAPKPGSQAAAQDAPAVVLSPAELGAWLRAAEGRAGARPAALRAPWAWQRRWVETRLRPPKRPAASSGTVVSVDGDKGDMRMRAIAELALAVETGGDVEQAVPAAFMAGVEPHEIADLSGLPMLRVLKILGRPET